MKTTIKTLTFLFAAVAFTACTNQSIEPIRPITQSQSATVRSDTASPILTDKNEASYKGLPNKMMVSDELNQNTLQPEIPAEPTPQPQPRLDVMPVEQLEAGIN